MTQNEKMKTTFWLFGQYWRLEYETFLHYKGLRNREALKMSLRMKRHEYEKFKANIPAYEWYGFINSYHYEEIKLPWRN